MPGQQLSQHSIRFCYKIGLRCCTLAERCGSQGYLAIAQCCNGCRVDLLKRHAVCFVHRASNTAMPWLTMAPEGTLSHGRCVLKFKTGAFAASMPVVPFVLRYKLAPHNPAWTIIIPVWHLVSCPATACCSIQCHAHKVNMRQRKNESEYDLYESLEVLHATKCYLRPS